MSSERLPSFKGPRDLTLSSRGARRDATGAGQSSTQARPRRVFTPNIPPPRRDRGAQPANTSSSAKDSNAPENSRGRPPRGRGGPRGGSRPTKQRGELLQSESIFSDGIGDPLAAKRNSAMSYKSGYGSRYKNATEGGPSRMSSMNRTTLNTIIKEEDDESNRKIFGSESFEQEQEDEVNSENPYIPVVLPLVGYVPELFLDPTTIEPEELLTSNLTLSEEEPTPGASKDVKIKEEKFDEDEVPIVQIKKEKIDDPEKDVQAGLGALAAMTLDSTTFAGTFRTSSHDGTLIYFQFPDELPILESSIRESVDQQDNGKNGADLVKDIGDLPEGFIGRMQILSSGRTRFVIGENAFDVDPGRPVGFRQDLFSVDIDTKSIANLGSMNRKFVVTPDIECLIRDAL